MKLDFAWDNDGQYHQYCLHCHAETVKSIQENGRAAYHCASCSHTHDRSIVIDPAINWWIAADGEYWHESAGIFVRNPHGKFLFFERTKFPFVLTIPAGHVNANEAPEASAVRELAEEVGIQATALTKIVTDDIVGDSCRRGSDAHRWHAYLLALDKPANVQVNDEGGNPVWLTLDEVGGKNFSFPTNYIIKHYPGAFQ